MAVASSDSVSRSYDPLIDGLLQGNSWTFAGGPRVLTYSLNQTGVYNSSWTPALEAATEAAFAAWEAVANVDFQRVYSGTYTWESTADIAIGLTDLRQYYTLGAIGIGFFPDPSENDEARIIIGNLISDGPFGAPEYEHPEGDIYLDNGNTDLANYLYPGGYGLAVILHEIGHAIGMKHPHDNGGNGWPTFASLGIQNLDKDAYTVMSYNGQFASVYDGNPSTPMVLDILAIQYVYGANMNYHTGNDTYLFTQDSVYAIWDAGGIDTIDATDGAGVYLKLDAGYTNVQEDTRSVLGIAYGVTIENAIGSFAQDFIWGNSADNTIWGAAGDDSLYGADGNDTLYGGDPTGISTSDDHLNGGAGADTLIGGKGNDIYDVDNASDASEDELVEAEGQGFDRIFSSITLSLAQYKNIEGLYLTGTSQIDGYGDSGDNLLYGNVANNHLWGGDGNDTLDDASDSDEDVFTGGKGDDIYSLDKGESIVELAGEGTDTVRTSLQNYTLGDDLENLEIYGYVGGSFAPWIGTGNALDNKITGSNFKDILDGGLGNDTLSGGGSADIYYLDSIGDKIVGEYDGFYEELDEARTWVSIGPASFNVEIFTLLGTDDLTCYGNSHDNVITGNSGANLLFGESGRDQIILGDKDIASGGAGIDSFSLQTASTDHPINATVTDFGFGEVITWSTLFPLAGAASQISWPIAMGNGLAAGLNELQYFSDGATVTLSFGLDEAAGADLFLTLNRWIAVGDLNIKAQGSALSIINAAMPDAAPTDILLSSSTVIENSALGTVIGTLSAVDADTTSGFVFELLKNAEGRFALDGNKLVVAGALDFEGLRDHAITLRVTDTSGNSFDETMTIKVLDVNDVSPLITSNGGGDSATIEIPENYIDTAAQVFAVDGDGLGNSPISYSISGGADKALFTIDAKTGEVRFLVGPDFEHPTSFTGTNNYVVEVKASDGLLSDTQLLTFKIKDVANNTTIVSYGGGDSASVAVTENALEVAQIVAVGDDSTSAFLYTIYGGADKDLFTINSKTGQLSFLAAPDFENPGGTTPDNMYFVDVQASDGFTSDKQSFTVTVVNGVGHAVVGTSGKDVVTGVSVVPGNTTNEDDVVNGLGGNDTIHGLAGDDFLDGGTGNDLLIGGAGNDTYVINSLGDAIDEGSNADIADEIRSTIGVDLAIQGGGAIERAQLNGSAAINAFGNAANNQLVGNSASNILDGRAGADVMTGGNGSDTYIVDSAGDQVAESNATPAGGIDTVRSSVSFALGANIENLSLTGKADIDGTGNALKNILLGNDGANRLDGGGGSDIMTGGKGNDIYVVDQIGDVVKETISHAQGGGVDLVESSISFSLANLAQVEDLTLLGSANVNGRGNALSNLIRGNSGDNVLDGGQGVDLLAGGAGNDVFIIDNWGDTAFEAPGGGIDEIRTNLQLSGMQLDIEYFTYTGSKALDFTGNTEANRIVGNTGADTISGAEGSDTLLGNGANDILKGDLGDDLLDGGGGDDKMSGGTGNDTYVVGSLKDIIDEEGASDTDDRVRSAVTVNLVTLAGGAIEHATLTGTAAANATGNAAANELAGNDGANILDGRSGADTMSGGKGGDTYVVDEVGDLIIETISGAAGGIDTVQCSIDFDLSTLINIERIALIGTAHQATGNGLANILTGNAEANLLDGGAGKDTMIGGAGDDTYVVNMVGDVVTESLSNAKGGGIDTVESAVTFSLAALGNVDNLTLTGNGNTSGTGNGLANLLVGNSGNNVLNGGAGDDTIAGGVGADKLTGGTGRDTFDYNELAAGADTIMDFKLGASGDILNLADLLDALEYSGTDAIADGVVLFSKVGVNTVVSIDSDGFSGPGAETLLTTLLNVVLTSANTENYTV